MQFSIVITDGSMYYNTHESQLMGTEGGASQSSGDNRICTVVVAEIKKKKHPKLTHNLKIF